MSDHLPGVYIYGALTIVLLFIANYLALSPLGILMTIVCAAASYFASLFGYARWNIACNAMLGVAVLTGSLSFLSILV